MEVRYLGLGEALLIAERILDVPADTLARNPRTVALLDSALAAPQAGFGGQDAHPTLEGKIAALGWHIVRDHPLPDGNKRLGLLSMFEMAERNGHVLLDDGPAINDAYFRALAAGEVSVEELTSWVHDRLRHIPEDQEAGEEAHERRMSALAIKQASLAEQLELGGEQLETSIAAARAVVQERVDEIYAQFARGRMPKDPATYLDAVQRSIDETTGWATVRFAILRLAGSEEVTPAGLERLARDCEITAALLEHLAAMHELREAVGITASSRTHRQAQDDLAALRASITEQHETHLAGFAATAELQNAMFQQQVDAFERGETPVDPRAALEDLEPWIERMLEVFETHRQSFRDEDLDKGRGELELEAQRLRTFAVQQRGVGIAVALRRAAREARDRG